MSRGWYGCDLDGCLAFYDHWRGPTHVGPPVPKMVERIKKHLAAGDEVRIMTARVYPLPFIRPDDDRRLFVGANDREASANASAIAILEWCEQHLGRRLAITCQKDYGLILLYDDRCRQVEANTGRLIGAEEE